MERVDRHRRDAYAGVPIYKFPEDLRVYEHLIWDMRADGVIEIGTDQGGAALWFRDRLRALGAYGPRAAPPHVVAIDLDPEPARARLAAADPNHAETITLVQGDVRDPGLPDAVAGRLHPGARYLVVEDSAHDRATTLAALRGFARFVPPGGYLVVEDGCVDVEAMRHRPDWPRGVFAALEEWLASPDGAGFATRRDLELYGVTCHPRGFLQRVGTPEPPRAPAPSAAPAGAGDGLDPALERELVCAPAWMYPWRLGEGREPPLLGSELPSVHETRRGLIEGPARAALAAAGPGATALDLGCCEGWFSHRLLEWGAARVLGVDARGQNVRRAELVRDHLGVPAERLAFRAADVMALDPLDLGRFDVVLVLGLIYHVERPLDVLRLARRLTERVCLVETQLTRQNDPLVHGWGTTEGTIAAAASFAAHAEPDAEVNPLAALGDVLSLVPNRAALDLMLRLAGFAEVAYPAPAPHHNPQYRAGDRAVAVAYPPGAALRASG